MIPTFDKFLYPDSIKDGKEHSVRSLMDEMAHIFSLSNDNTEERVSSGSENKLHNRTQWATTYLDKAGLM